MATRALLVYPEMPPTYWSMKYAVRFLGKRASIPPLGLLTVAAMLPEGWRPKLVDMNVERLTERAMARADVVMVSAMLIQKASFDRVIAMANRLGKKVIAGGPYPAACHERIEGVDHFVLGEAESVLPDLLRDLERGTAARVYAAGERPDLAATPIPRFDLMRGKRYAAMALQFSRGCPHSCEFCDIIEMFGRVPRTKTPEQFVAEMDAVYREGWRGSLFVVDDNFIANVKRVKRLLAAIGDWQRRHDYPFGLFTEATLELASDPELMDLMVEAGFNMVFLGIETPDPETLRAANKRHNLRGDMLQSVRKIQMRGMEVSAGFILGFDSDREDVFDQQLRFIDQAAIPTAMVGLLTAVPNTQLYRRLAAEGRLLDESAGNNTHDLRLNFVPRMDVRNLLAGYTRVLSELYRPDRYFERCLKLLTSLTPHRGSVRTVRLPELRAFLFSLLVQGCSSYAPAYWRYLLRGLRARPRMLAETVTMAVKGHHFFKITRNLLELDRLRRSLEQLAQSVEERLAEVRASGGVPDLAEIAAARDRALARVRAHARRLHRDFRFLAEDAAAGFEATLAAIAERMGVARTTLQS